MSAEAVVADPWLLTRAISPRDRVRVASIDAHGTVLNQYAASRAVHLEPPTAPWAVHLADNDGYRLLAFDFDTKRAGDVTADARLLVELLTAVGLPSVVCQSGPSGGRHVWTATQEAVDPALIGSMARLAAASLPTLDIAPLRNAATGCVRPPGSPHRDGGVSQILAGDLTCLLHPTGSRAAIEQLVTDLAHLITGDRPYPDPSPNASTTRLDTAGHLYLPGQRRPLPPASQAALHTPTADLDASVTLNTVLLGAAASHWHLADIAALLSTAAGLEHIRTRRTHTGRTPRTPHDQAETLSRQWRYAVRYVAEHPRQTGLDQTWDTRAGELTDLVRDLQEHADAAVGRWTRSGGPSDRRVLDCLHLWALTSVKAEVEADTRRIALTCGIGRETARVALLRLAADGWIHQHQPAAGVHGATWTIRPPDVLPSGTDSTRAQAATRPEGAGAAERSILHQQLTSRLALATHDLFTGNHALPLAAGNLYARLATASTGDQLTPSPADERLLEQLERFNLITRRFGDLIRLQPAQRDAAAHQLGVDGRLDDRRHRYQAERAVWAWWQAEREWMCGPRTSTKRTRADQAPLWQSSTVLRYPKHPRGPNGRANFPAARAAVDAGALSAPFLAA